ncbi:MAG: transporter component [Thermoproteota archaeon]|nr:transporter component [Thermoproteota archaeon]
MDNSKIVFSQSKKLSLIAVMAALIAVTTLFAIPMPPPLSTINLAPVIIFIVSILLGPTNGVMATAIGCSVGYLVGTSVGTILIPPGFFYIFLVGLVVARSPMAFVAGLLRKRSVIIGMVLGVFLETLIFLSIDVYLFGLAIALFDLGVLVDLIFVPVTYALLIVVRRFLGVKYLT